MASGPDSPSSILDPPNPTSKDRIPSLSRASSSYQSAEKGGKTRSPPHSPETPPKRPRFLPSLSGNSSPTKQIFGETSVQGMGRAVVGRVVRMAKRGNLPFLVVFLGCLGIFFSALAGVGYVDPETSLSVPIPTEADFMPGSPVFEARDPVEVERNRMLEEHRALEMSWQRKKRPQDGAWMHKARDDKAVRRIKPTQEPEIAVVADDEAEGGAEREGIERRKRDAEETGKVEEEKLD